jgi:hypothetical protein
MFLRLVVVVVVISGLGIPQGSRHGCMEAQGEVDECKVKTAGHGDNLEESSAVWCSVV